MKLSISIIGAGSVGQALGKAFFNAGFTIDKIISKSAESAKSLADLTQSEWSSDLSSGICSDLIIVAVPDSILPEISDKITSIENSLIVHTAASCGMDVFDSLSSKGVGVFYPLQTFTVGRNIDFENIAILIEADSSDSELILRSIAESLSSKVYIVNAEDRKMIHLAAVFVCNFINHIYYAGEQLSGKSGLPASVLDALIDETLSKFRDIGPQEAQTGPALRNDISTIEKHRELLSYSQEFRDIYDAITRSIIKNKRLD